MNTGRVLLVTGPAGSGKSTLADLVAQTPGWGLISEDTYWVKHGWSGRRTIEQESIVQKEVVGDLRKLCEAGNNVVLEFILYKKPPNPLVTYINQLRSLDIEFDVIVLRPSVDAIIERIRKRGRPADIADLKTRRTDALSQIACLEDDSINSSWIVDSTRLSPVEVFEIIKGRLR